MIDKDRALGLFPNARFEFREEIPEKFVRKMAKFGIYEKCSIWNLKNVSEL